MQHSASRRISINRHIYPELARRRHSNDAPVTFPATCPACGAPKVSERPQLECSYACGGGYREKPQIQNHTDVFWGSCSAESGG